MADRISALKALAEAATPGPWKVVGGNRSRQFHMASIQATRGAIHESLSNTSPVARIPWYGGEIGGSNAAYIAALSPDVALKLLAVVEAAKAVCDETTDYGDSDWQSVFNAAEALRACMAALEEGK